MGKSNSVERIQKARQNVASSCPNRGQLSLRFQFALVSFFPIGDRNSTSMIRMEESFKKQTTRCAFFHVWNMDAKQISGSAVYPHSLRYGLFPKSPCLRMFFSPNLTHHSSPISPVAPTGHATQKKIIHDKS